MGQGRTGTVYKGRRKRTIEYVAIKTVDRLLKDDVLQEVRVLHACDHPNILSFHAWYETTRNLWLILEFCVGGDLRAILNSDQRLPSTVLLGLAYQLASALQYLHGKGTLHCDLCPKNVLLDEHGNPRLSGFSRSRKLCDPSQPHWDHDRLAYAAPELLQGATFSVATDLWSLGCLLYECCTGYPPFSGGSPASLGNLIMEQEPPSLPSSVDGAVKDFILGLLKKDPAQRLDWEKIREHPVIIDAGKVIHSMESLDVPKIVVESDDDATLVDLETAPRVASQEVVAYAEREEALSKKTLHDMVWHVSDDTIKPIVGNRKIEKPLSNTYIPTDLPFADLSAHEFSSASQSAQCLHLQSIHRTLAGQALTCTKLSALCYLETLCMDSVAANNLINTDLVLFMCRMLHNSGSSSIRVRLAHLLGLLFRHASSISEHLAQAGVIDALVDCASQKEDISLARRSMASLGEFLFYISSHYRQSLTGLEIWKIDDRCKGVVFQAALHPAEDEVLQLYAVKSLENIFSQGGCWAESVATRELGNSLLSLSCSTTSETVSGGAASAVARLLRLRHVELEAPLLEMLYGSALSKANLTAQQACLTIFCLTTLRRKIVRKEACEALFNAWPHLMESGNEAVQGKAVLAVAVVLTLDSEMASDMLSESWSQQIDRPRGSINYTSKCLEILGEKACLVANEPLTFKTAHLLALLFSSNVVRKLVLSEELIVKLSKALPSSIDWLGGLVQLSCEDDALLTKYRQSFLKYMCPSLGRCIAAADDASIKFSFMKLLCDILLHYASNGNGSADLDVAVARHTLPLIPQLFKEEDPIPLYALKMVGMLLQCNPEWSQSLTPYGVFPTVFEWLAVDHPNNNVWVARLCRYAVEEKTVSPSELKQMKAAFHAISVLKYAVDNEIDPFIEPALELCAAIVYTGIEVDMFRHEIAVFQELASNSEYQHLAMPLVRKLVC